MNWKWKCTMKNLDGTVCPKIMETPEDVMKHVLMEHRWVGLYAAPILVDEWTLPVRKVEPQRIEQPKPVFKPKPKKEVVEEPKEEEYIGEGEKEEYEDLTL